LRNSRSIVCQVHAVFESGGILLITLQGCFQGGIAKALGKGSADCESYFGRPCRNVRRALFGRGGEKWKKQASLPLRRYSCKPRCRCSHGVIPRVNSFAGGTKPGKHHAHNKVRGEKQRELTVEGFPGESKRAGGPAEA